MNTKPGARDHITLVGFMGTGKTATGRVLAERLGRPLLDMDAEIERREGRPIADIFRDSGEPHFRGLERALTRELAARSELIIAAGGGLVLDPDNIRDLEASGLVVCLEASPECILERVRNETHRPLLQAPDRLDRIRALLETRRPMYERVRYRIQTDGQTPERTADLILALRASLME
ncbi:MAG: shikimate kinase [Kiritimatiellae bacterium]|nr:shikimate kinase [Kiritimatiellia bacterium]